MNNIRPITLLSLSLISVLLFSSCSAHDTVKPESKPEIKVEAKQEAKVEIKQEVKVETKQETLPLTTLSLDRTKFKQGEFIQVLVKGATKKPRVWFNSKEFPSYETSVPETYRALVPVENLTKPGLYSVLARYDNWEQKIPVTVADNGKGVSRITLDPDKADLYPTEKELNAVGHNLRVATSKKLWNGKFVYPSKARRSSPFGVKRSYNGGPVDSYHKGLDFAGDMGSPVYAPADAKVALTGYEKDGFIVHGNVIILDHGQSVTSIYMHLSKIDVKEGQEVKQGEKIGEVGHTGISTGPHLHWGVYLSGISTEPELFVKQDVL